MCGRFTLIQAPEMVAERFAVDELLFHFPPRFNIAPTQAVAVVTENGFGDGKRVLEGMRWGLIPSWAKDESIGAKLINARAETLLEKPSFRTAIKRRRCIVPASGFYEWQTRGKEKVAHYIHFKDGRLFGLAGLWEEWQAPDGSPLRSVTIVTGDPNPLLATLHHRMAVILPPEAEDTWLDPSLESAAAVQLLSVFPDEELEAYPVTKRVGNVQNEDEGLILPLPAEEGAGAEKKARTGAKTGEEDGEQLALEMG